jgi:GMP synthase (glutamine-hydrolysing)
MNRGAKIYQKKIAANRSFASLKMTNQETNLKQIIIDNLIKIQHIKRMHNKVLILDFGSQFTQLIARRIRENGVYSEIQPYNFDINQIKGDYSAIIFSGGPNSVYDADSPDIDTSIFDLDLPILGLCYGQQLIGQKFGGTVEKSNKREYGRAILKVLETTNENLLFDKVPAESQVWMSHGDHLTTLPEGFELLGTTENCHLASIGNFEKKIYGIQFHPEVHHSDFGTQMIANFLFHIAKIIPDWNPASFIEDQIGLIRKQVGQDRVLCGLSGGVDSSVVAAILHEAIGSQLHCVFVDNGLLRMNEKEEVESVFRDSFNISLTVVDASEIFLSRLKGITDPETKRKIIGNTFIEVFDIAQSYEQNEIMIKEDLSVKVVK